MHQPANTSTTRLPIIGILGGIGSGKSTIARAFASHNCLVIDFDKEVRELLNTKPVLDTLVSWWGPGIRNPDGTANRKAIAAQAFASEANRQRLEHYIHPLVHRSFDQIQAEGRAANAAAVILDAPLLIEAGYHTICDAIAFVDVPLNQRLDRVTTSRGWSASDLHKREAAQTPLDEKRAIATHTIPNQAPLNQQQLSNLTAAVLADATHNAHKH